MPSEMDKVHFETIGRNDSSSFSFPKRISGRTPPSLLDRMTSQVVTETTAATTHVDTNLTRSPKAARSQNQRVRPDSQPALVNRISAPDTPALLNRISAPELLPRIAAETQVSPSTKKKGPSADSEPSSDTGTLHVEPHTTKNISPVLAPIRHSPIPKASSPILIVAKTPPRSAKGPPATLTPMQVDSPPVASVAFSSAALTVAAPHSTIGTVQSSISDPSNNHDMEPTPNPPSNVLPPRKDIPVEPEAPLSAVAAPIEENTPTISQATTSVLARAPVAPTAPTDLPSWKDALVEVSTQSSTPVQSPTKVTRDMITFYLKPVWAESAAQMLEWAEVANEREETQKQEQQQKSAETVPNSNNNQDQKIRETLDRGIQKKRARPDDDGDSGEVGADVVPKRIKLSAAQTVAPSITPPPATPPTISPSQAEAQSELVVVEERTTIMDRPGNIEGTKVGRQDGGAVSPLQATPPVVKALEAPKRGSNMASDAKVPDGGDESLAQNKPSTPGEPQVADTVVATPASSSVLQAKGAASLAHQPTLELPEGPLTPAGPSPAAEAIDEAAVIRRKYLEQELAFQQREKQERKRQLELERAKREAAERLLKEREEVLREAVKQRKMEKAEAQAAPSPSLTVAIPVTAPVSAVAVSKPLPTSKPLPASSGVVSHDSPPRAPHPLPPKPQPVSGGVALGTSSSAQIMQKAVPQVVSPSVSNDTNPRTAKTVSEPTNPAAMEPTGTSKAGTKDVAPSPPQSTAVSVSIPAPAVSQQVPFLIKKEEPRTPSIPRVVPTIAPPAQARVPSSLKNASKPGPSAQAVSRPPLESRANGSGANPSPTGPHVLIKPEPSSDQPLEREIIVKLGKRSRSPSLPASVPLVTKKRRETSPNLELTYPDESSETSGWGQVEMEQDDEERRTGGRRRVRSLTPADSEGRGRGRTPVRWQRSPSRSRSRSRSPLHPARGRALSPPRGGRGRGRGRGTRGRPIDNYERRLPPRSPPRRALRSPSPVGSRERYNRESPPLRGGRGRPERVGAESYPPPQRHYDYPSDRRPTYPYHHAPQPGSRFDPNEPEYRLPPRESDSLTRRLPADRAPPIGPSADRTHHPEPPRHPFPPPTSSLPRSGSPPRETYPHRRGPPVGSSAARSQNLRPTSPLQPPRAISPHGPPPHVVHRSPPVVQSEDRSQYANQPPNARVSGNAPEDPRSSLGRHAAPSSEQYAPAPSRGRGAKRPISDRAVTAESQRASNRFRPYSPTRRTSGPAHAAVEDQPPVPLTHAQSSLSLRDRISPENQPDTLRVHEGPAARGGSHRGRGAGPPSRGGRGGRIKLSDRLSDAQAGGALAGRVSEPQ